jgi:flagellar FliL protein
VLNANAGRHFTLVAMALLVLVVLTAYATLQLSRSEGMNQFLERWVYPQPPAKKLSDKPLFKSLDKFVISVDSAGGRRYLVLEMALVTHDPEQYQQFDEVNPALRNAAVELFSQRSYDEMRAALQNVNQLQDELLNKFRQTLQAFSYQPALDKVLITKIVMQ